jgi:hypothetical protein
MKRFAVPEAHTATCEKVLLVESIVRQQEGTGGCKALPSHHVYQKVGWQKQTQLPATNGVDL